MVGSKDYRVYNWRFGETTRSAEDNIEALQVMMRF